MVENKVEGGNDEFPHLELEEERLLENKKTKTEKYRRLNTVDKNMRQQSLSEGWCSSLRKENRKAISRQRWTWSLEN